VRKTGTLIVTLSAAALLMVTMGTRQSLGLFVSPLNTSTGLGIATISHPASRITRGQIYKAVKARAEFLRCAARCMRDAWWPAR